MSKKIIAIIDTLAGENIGPLLMFRADAPAIRFFSDAANDQQTPISKHVEDYELVELGVLNDKNEIVPGKRVIITGAQWYAAQQKLEERESLSLMENR